MRPFYAGLPKMNLRVNRNFIHCCHLVLRCLYFRSHGKKRAAIARHEPYRDLGADYFDQQRPESVKKRLVKR